jgi:SAM-dependent methyltransferase
MDDGATDSAGDGADDHPGEPEAGDAFGEILRDHHAGEETSQIIERDDGWIGPSAGGEFYFRAFEEWVELEQRAMDHVEGQGRVLDVGCGAGRHALYLQNQGHDVTGIDRSPGAVAVARDRGVEDVREVDVADVAEAFDPGTFDSVVMMGNNFGLVGTTDRGPAILDALAEVATDDATLVAQSRDPAVTDDDDHRSYHEFNRERGRLPGALRIRVRYGGLATEWFDYLMAAPETMSDLASETPWDLAETLEPDEQLTDDGGDYVGILRTDR